MTNNINPINIGANGLTFQPKGKNEKAEIEQPKQPMVQPEAGAKKEVSADDVLNHLAAQNMDIKPSATRTIDVAKYVTPAQAQRIAGFVTQFEQEVGKGLQLFDQEFGPNYAKDNEKLELVVDYFNRLYM